MLPYKYFFKYTFKRNSTTNIQDEISFIKSQNLKVGATSNLSHYTSILQLAFYVVSNRPRARSWCYTEFILLLVVFVFCIIDHFEPQNQVIFLGEPEL